MDPFEITLEQLFQARRAEIAPTPEPAPEPAAPPKKKLVRRKAADPDALPFGTLQFHRKMEAEKQKRARGKPAKAA